MRPNDRPTLGLAAALALALLAGPSSRAGDAPAPTTPAGAGTPADATPARLGDGPAFRTLAELPVLHVENEGSRVKPLDTFSRLVVKEIYGRESIKVPTPDGEHETTWSAVGALFDWPVNPAAWDGREIILLDMFDYRGFKQWLLTGTIKAELASIAAKPTTSAADRRAIEPLSKAETISEKDLEGLLARTSLEEADRAAVATWAGKLAEGRKWIAPADLEAAEVAVEGRAVNFLDRYHEVIDRARASAREGLPVSLEGQDKKVREVGDRLLMYQGFRDRNAQELSALDILVTPRPYGEAYLKYNGALVKALVGREKQPHEMSAWDRDVLATLQAYLDDILSVEGYLGDVARGKQKPPGEDPAFDRTYAQWLREKSRWVPLRIVLNGDLDELARAGFDRRKVEDFRAAFDSLVAADRSRPGEASEAPAAALLAAARGLGESNNAKIYPEPVAMARETHFNRFAPFSRAPIAYGAGLVLLLISLGVTAGRRVDAANRLDLLLYGLGMLAFVAGIGLEVYGFYLRVVISGWAPVTNMYETVIWVAAVAAVLGLVLEVIFRTKYAAIAATGMALLATLLAANVPLLDSNIKSLTPVLRDNYWLTIHVLTIVSSYAAFTLALGLGLLAIGYYLSATYRRDVGYAEVASPLALGLPLLGLCALVVVAIQKGWLGGALDSTLGYGLAALFGVPGGFLAVTGLYGLLGEYANRRPRPALGLGLLVTALGTAGIAGVVGRDAPSWWPSQLPTYFVPGFVALSGLSLAMMTQLGGRSRHILIAAGEGVAALDEAAIAGEAEAEAESDEQLVAASAASPSRSAKAGAGSVATLARPSVAEIRARMAANRPKLDPRDEAMQSVAGHVKPLSNFVYRAMQVGVLLVAAGTILGGVWADVSWGRFWGWDAKEVWALITLLVYLVPLHGRFAGWVSTFGLVGASVVCYMSVLMAWYGVNFVLGVGLHSYGFTEGGGQGVVGVCVLAMLGIVGATAWRRWLGKRDRSAFA